MDHILAPDIAYINAVRIFLLWAFIKIYYRRRVLKISKRVIAIGTIRETRLMT